jgi:pantoate--beta-alanine ligase
MLCGEFRPGHFQGVATVVSKLLNIVQPDVAVFGEKDFQQLAVIRRMVSDLCMPVGIVGEPTVRESDGLALSSRNRYLSAEDRRVAPAIYATLQTTRRAIEAGERDFAKLEEHGFEALRACGFRPDYFAIREAATLQVPSAQSHEFVILTAARIGNARLIDNVVAKSG